MHFVGSERLWAHIHTAEVFSCDWMTYSVSNTHTWWTIRHASSVLYCLVFFFFPLCCFSYLMHCLFCPLSFLTLCFLAVFCVCDYQWPGFFWLWLVSCSHAASIAPTALFGSGSKVRAAQGLRALRGRLASPWAECGWPGLARHPWEGPGEGWRVRFKHAACGPRGWQNALALDTRVFVFAWTTAAFLLITTP